MTHEAKNYESESLWDSSRYELEKEQRRFLETRQLIPADSESLCDCGCGNGAFLKFLEDDGWSGHLTGVERSPLAIRKKICSAQVAAGDLQLLPFADGAFHTVSCLEVLEHLPCQTYEKSLKELERVSARYILVSVPYREQRWFVSCPYCDCSYSPYYHVRVFDEAALGGLFRNFGLVRTVLVGEVLALRPLAARLVGAGKALLGWKSRADFYTVCPQCGYTLQDRPAGKPGRSGGNIKTFAVGLLLVRRPEWAVCLYKRRG